MTTTMSSQGSASTAPTSPVTSMAKEQPEPSVVPKPGKLLMAAMEKCIAAYVAEEA